MFEDDKSKNLTDSGSIVALLRDDCRESMYCFHKDPGLGDLSTVYPKSSVGNTFAFDVVEDTGPSLTNNVFFFYRNACACVPETHLSPWFPRY